jgi:transcriptional regulator with XRE-family HTH domain
MKSERNRAAAAFFHQHAPASVLESRTLHRLRAAREAAGLTTGGAALIIGKTQSTYSKIERGQVQLSAIDALTLCDRFGLSLDELLQVTA